MPTLKLVHAKRMTVRLDSGLYSPVILQNQTFNFTDAEAKRALADGYSNLEGEFRCYWKKVEANEPEPEETVAKPKRTRKTAAA